MIRQEYIDNIKKLLAEGNHSHREIARITRISRATISNIANGKRADHHHKGPEVGRLFRGHPERCKGCGGMVYMPCMLCEVRAKKERDWAGRDLARMVNK